MTKAIITVDLGYGDAGKGTIVDSLTRKTAAGLVVRYNGGSQCGHNVVTDEGIHHVFAQFGSGSFAGVPTLLSKHVLVNPLDALLEGGLLDKKLGYSPNRYLYISEEALITTPFHVVLNQLKELSRDGGRHGSCGKGIGETVAYSLTYPEDAIRGKDLANIPLLKDKLESMQSRILSEVLRLPNLLRDECKYMKVILQDLENLASQYNVAFRTFNWITEDQVANLIRSKSRVIFEGAQGILLDENHGFHPHTTWSTTTTKNAHEILDAAGVQARHTIGITRTFMTRHGAGPFPTEDNSLPYEDPHNPTNPWQQNFRVGHFDVPSLRYAIDVNGGIDSLAVTHMDLVEGYPEWKFAHAYSMGQKLYRALVPQYTGLEEQGRITEDLFEVKPLYQSVGKNWVPVFIERMLDVPIGIISHGPSAKSKSYITDFFWK